MKGKEMNKCHNPNCQCENCTCGDNCQCTAEHKCCDDCHCGEETCHCDDTCHGSEEHKCCENKCCHK